MNSKEVREKFLHFFAKKNHTIVPSSSLLPGDPSVLLTTAGMQQFKPYFLGTKSPYGNRVASCQKSFRTSDIEEVGRTARHLTFFEMLGNFSFDYPKGENSYFKKEAIELAFEFLTKDCKIEPGKLWLTIFRGEGGVPRDEESFTLWRNLGFEKEKILEFDRKDNFWGPTGREGPCGPTTEIHYDLTAIPCQKARECLPNCQCDRFIELWNLVFNEFFQDETAELSPLKQKGIDTGMGLERLAMVLQGKKSVFETDLFEPILKEISLGNQKAERIIADHSRAAVFLVADGVLPSKGEQGYILRRILRRAIRFGKILRLKDYFLIDLAKKIIENYQAVYPEVKSREAEILTVLQKEEEQFEKTLQMGLKEFKAEIGKCSSKVIPGKIVFDLYQSYGFPLELTQELAKEEGFRVDEKDFQEEFKRHQEISRAGAERKFGGHGLELITIPEKEREIITKFHTATHLLHQALREVLGEQVQQMGSDINAERLRFDFSHSQKMTAEEIKKVEDLVNQKIKEDLKVKREEMSSKEALKGGALAFFKERYPEKVNVYTIFDENSGNIFSKEICAGPHVKKTSELGQFKIKKEESSGAGVRRIRAVLS